MFSAEVAAIVCEHGVALCILLEIFSLRASADHQGVNKIDLQSQIALGIGSLIATCAALVIKFLGAAAALRAMHTVWTTLRLSLRPSMRGESPKRVFVGGAQVVPAHSEGDEGLLVPESDMAFNKILRPL